MTQAPRLHTGAVRPSGYPKSATLSRRVRRFDPSPSFDVRSRSSASFSAVMSTHHSLQRDRVGGEPLLDAQIRSGGSRPAAWWKSMATRRAMACDLGMPDTF
jgi:hypothetical protein